MNSLNRMSFCILACPCDFSRWCVSLAGEEDPVCHRTPQRCQEGDGGEPLPVSRAISAEREGEHSHPLGGTGTLDELGHPQRPPRVPGPATEPWILLRAGSAGAARAWAGVMHPLPEAT